MAEKRWKIVLWEHRTLRPPFSSISWNGTDVRSLQLTPQPDRKCGRGQKVRCSAVKDVALKNDIPVYQPLNFKDEKDVEDLRALEPDFLVVAAYGLILPQSVLDVPAVMPINVHASLLPKYRGAAPIHRAVANGDHATGITIMKMEAGLDTGPILVQQALGIAWDDFTGKVHDELADMGGPLVMETLLRYRDGRLTVMPQDDSIATYAEKLSKEEGLIDWNLPVKEVHNKIRGMYPWPGAYYFWTPEGKEPIRLVLSPGKPGDEEVGDHAPGTIVGEYDGMLGIACQDKIYLASKVKPAGKKEMDGKAFMCGYMNKC